MYPGIKHTNKYFITGTRICQCIKLQQDIYQFERYLRIRYDSQPNPNIKDNIVNIENTPISTNHVTPIITNNEEQVLLNTTQNNDKKTPRTIQDTIQQETPKPHKPNKPNQSSIVLLTYSGKSSTNPDIQTTYTQQTTQPTSTHQHEVTQPEHRYPLLATQTQHFLQTGG